MWRTNNSEACSEEQKIENVLAGSCRKIRFDFQPVRSRQHSTDSLRIMNLLKASLGLMSALALSLNISNTTHGADPKAITSQEVQSQVNDAKVLNDYFSQEFGAIGQLLGTDVDKAEARLKELTSVMKTLKPQDVDSQQLIPRANNAVDYFKVQISSARTSIEEVTSRLSEHPEDLENIRVYVTKQSMILEALVGQDTNKAEKGLQEVLNYLRGIKEKAKTKESQTTLDGAMKQMEVIQTSIDNSRKMAALTGKQGAPMAVETWINGTPLSQDDLKGKVVLLDFWAVWCGPCIRTFPHLRHLHTTYKENGLVIIGLTGYYNYTWNDTSKRAIRSQDKVEAAEEQKMLAAFAASNELKHRFAIQSDDSMAEYYGVTGIPHVVLLDREGKVALMRIGSGDQNAKDIEDKIKELL
jgi:thiol-disulfide isomerase/thioredoxin